MKTYVLLFLFLAIKTFSQDSIKTNIYREKVGDAFVIYADNHEAAPASFEYNYVSENMSSTAKNKEILVFAPYSKKNIISELKHINKKLPTKFSYNVYSVLGDVKSTDYDSNYLYNLPFDVKKSYRVDQGYNGNFSHQNAFSLDFNMKTGDKVYAARDGIVVKMTDVNDKSCLTKDCAKYNNQIIILHSDGSFAEYVHLKKDGSVVKINDAVKKGQHIGYSGGTGWAKGPHLHFSVYKNKMNGERTYFKTKFRTSANTDGILLEQGKSYSRTE